MQKLLLILCSLFFINLTAQDYSTEELGGFPDLPIVGSSENVDTPIIGVTMYTKDDGFQYTKDNLGVETQITFGITRLIPSGGLAGQILSKVDGSDYNVEWITIATGGPDASEVGAIAAGSTLGLQQSLLANAGQPALTVLAVGNTTSGKVQGVSLGAGNVVEVFASGADFNQRKLIQLPDVNGDLKDVREFMAFGEPICFTGLPNGAIITSTQGFYGFGEQVDGNFESPMPLLSYGLSFQETFMFGFRGCEAGGNGEVYVVNGPLDNTIKFTDGFGTVQNGQENIDLEPWEHYVLETNGNKEYIISGTNNMMASHAAHLISGGNKFADSRLIMPLTNDGITWPRSGFVNSPYANTVVNTYTRDGESTSLNSGNGVSPGSPVDFDALPPVGTGATDSDYEPNGATRVLAVGVISAYSGADSSGYEATPLMPTSAMSQVVAQPLFIDNTGDGGNSSVSIAGEGVGTAYAWQWNSTNSNLDLIYTIPLNRTGVTVNSKEDQKHPTAGQVANETGNGSISFIGDLGPGVITADVPITVVVQNGTPTQGPNNTIRSQNGTTTTGIVDDDDETLSLGWTPATLKADIIEGADGILYKRIVTGGNVTFAQY